MNNACIMGYGVVGKATALAFGIDKHFDINGDANITLKEAADCRFIFICLPTPTVNGECDTSGVREVIRQIEEIRANGIYIIRSTVTPGTADAIMNDLDMDRVISNPEFLSEDSWEQDAKRPSVAVIGCRDLGYAQEVKGIYDSRYKYFKATITDNVTAETIKYAFNTFFATKVIFANQIYDVCQKNNANYSVIQELLTKHPWGSGHHFEVFHKGGRGAKGKCLPKDLEAFVTYSQSPLLKTVMEVNNDFGGK